MTTTPPDPRPAAAGAGQSTEQLLAKVSHHQSVVRVRVLNLAHAVSVCDKARSVRLVVEGALELVNAQVELERALVAAIGELSGELRARSEASNGT